jgi:tRNA-2-methylthio-N6-dimethylallyladenosine synthase
MNLADSGSMAAILDSRGLRPAESEEDADFIILNTCSVRERAEERVFGRLGELSGLKKKDPQKKIIVVGCMAQRLGDKILRRATAVDIVLGTDRIFEIDKFINKSNGRPSVNVEFGHIPEFDLLPIHDSPYSAFVTISRGCDQFCSYCIVPYLRGRERSIPSDDIVRQINRFAADGVREITLLGQNVNSYRHNGIDFPLLLKRICSETAIERIRFMTSHPKDLSESLINILASEPKMMGHLHLPLQSGSDRILEKMGRGYTVEHYLGLVRKLREMAPDISLTTDLIVGFPSETEEEFHMTLNAVETIRFDSAFMFRYSSRAGTKAAELTDDVPEGIKISRLTSLINLQKKISYEKNQDEIGRVRSVLVDGFSRRSRNILRGKTEGNKTILFGGDPKLIGTIMNIRVNSADSWTLRGEPEV